MKKFAIVTGGTGFIGKNLIHKLVSDEWKVSILHRKNSDLRKLLYDDIDYIDKYNIDEKSISEIFRDISRRVDMERTVIFHIAALVQGGVCKDEDIDELISSNVTYGTQILNAAVEVGIKNFINTGTAWQHYNNEEYNPVNLYAASKEALEDILKYYEDAYGVKKITLQLFDTYGTNDSRKKILDLIFENINNKKILNMSPGEQYIDLVYIDDIIDAYIIAADYLLSHNYEKCGVYGVSSEEPIKLKELVRLVEDLTGSKTMINFGGRAYRQREVMEPWKNYPTLPGWRKKINIRDGICKLISLYDNI